MSSEQHTVVTCDRCGHQEISPPHNGPANWWPEGDWASVTVTPHKLHSRVDTFRLLCPECSAFVRQSLTPRGRP